jgi:hypothetical protein
MGSSYYKNVTQWSKGEYADANNQEDDISVIADDLGLVRDDVGDTIDTASAVVTDGVINNSSDVDWFYFDVAVEGWLTLRVTPSWGKDDPYYHKDARRGSNLDIEVALVTPYDDVSVLDNLTDTEVVIDQKMYPGRYYFQVRGTSSENYTEYDSIGQYHIDLVASEGNQSPYSVVDRCPSDSTLSGLDTIYMFSGKGVDVVLDGAASYDKDGFIVKYEWLESGVVYGTDQVLNITLKEGAYAFVLRTTDNEGATNDVAEYVMVSTPSKGDRRRLKQFQEICN